MATNKKNIKVGDLKPSKDAKGGGAHTLGHTAAGAHTLGGTRQGGHTLGSSKNDQKHQGHGHSGHN